LNRALRRISLACLAMFVLLLVNVNYLQAIEANNLTTKPGNARAFAQQFQYQRGSIYTADNVLVAGSRAVSGIYKYQRYYPHGPEYAPVTGYDSIYGKTGVEGAENGLLSGSSASLAVHNLIDLITGKPKLGATVALTINSKAQLAAYNALRASGKSGALVALNPQTGAILAMVSYPTFNPNDYATFDGTQLNKVDRQYRGNPNQPLLNRAIQNTYHPGSTFKIVTSSALFSAGNYSPQTNVDAPTNLQLPQSTAQLINFDNEPCTNGSGTGKVPIIFAFTISCNTVFGELGMNIGTAAIQQQANKFGMNNPSLAIPLPVVSSNYPLARDKAQTAISAIGQLSDTVSPLQEAMFSAAIANGGKLMTPYLVQDVKAPDLSTIQQTTPTVLSQTVSQGVASEVSQMMASVVSDAAGTAHQSAGTQVTGGITIAAKTGTAQTGVNNTGLDDAVFTAFAPVANPRIAVGVIVKGGGLGADASAPIAVQVIKAYLGQG